MQIFYVSNFIRDKKQLCIINLFDFEVFANNLTDFNEFIINKKEIISKFIQINVISSSYGLKLK